MTRVTPATPPSLPSLRAKKAEEIVRLRDVKRDLGAILQRAARQPVRISSKHGARMFHIATIRRGDRHDPAWADSMAVTIAALKHRARRILHLASGLQITLRVQVAAKSLEFYFIEPGSACLEFATRGLGGSSRDSALLRNAVRRSPITRAAVETAVRQVSGRRLDEIKSLQARIATLERSVERKRTDLAEALRKSQAALQRARQSLKAADVAAKKDASDRDEETQNLKSQIASLERALKKRSAMQAANRNATIPKLLPEPEPSPPDTAEDEASGTASIETA